MSNSETEPVDRSPDEVQIDRSLPPFDPARPPYRDLDHHWYECRVCGGKSLDSDTYALMRGGVVPVSSVTHDRFCPGAVFPEKHVRRITQV